MRKPSIRETLYAHGLCMTCRNAPSCTFASHAGAPVTDCLEFDGEVPVEPAPTRASITTQSRRVPAVDRPTLPGLCGTCDWRDGCTFPRPASGVWFCEEYE
jgi:hypothetical protein